ncbi:MAG: anaerobic ribonucleoside-triphosphate reductase activating protein [Bacteroidales bacterium]|nr:anaerobic ribonucleoside-triphosphate reductase activating protein [Bacteroidales bacterium]
MLHYTTTDIVFQEIPDEVTLAINISGCPCRCPGCHSPQLWNNIGSDLDSESLQDIIAPYANSISTVAFMGGDAEPEVINCLAKAMHVRFPRLKAAWWSGRTHLSPKIDLCNFNYIKLGPYLAHLGPLRSPTTNQRLYKVVSNSLHDITYQYRRLSQSNI